MTSPTTRDMIAQLKASGLVSRSVLSIVSRIRFTIVSGGPVGQGYDLPGVAGSCKPSTCYGLHGQEITVKNPTLTISLYYVFQLL